MNSGFNCGYIYVHMFIGAYNALLVITTFHQDPEEHNVQNGL